MYDVKQATASSDTPMNVCMSRKDIFAKMVKVKKAYNEMKMTVTNLKTDICSILPLVKY